jgi:3',5'-cyclic AMP phosphodiesterase CpdA
VRTIAHISDLHFDRIDPPVVEGLARDLAERERPTLLVCSGDFTQRARERQYAHAAGYMTRLPAPQLLIPGNHDIPLYDLIRRFFFPLHRYRRHMTRDLRPVYQDDELLVIGINTARPFTWHWRGFWKDGAISEEQLLDVELRAANLGPQVFKIVVTHHPFIPPPGERPHGIVHGAARALDEMEKSGIDMLLAGHLHMGYSGDVRTHFEAAKRSVLSVQAGTATSTRRRGEPNAYNWITIRSTNEVEIEVRAWAGSRFSTSTVKRLCRVDGVWEWQA